jgi:DNA-binding response OmpR family regulator
MVLDIMLPGIDGFSVISELRGAGNFIPTLILTARGHADDVLKGFASGADDYLTKPFGVDELNARLRVALRHAAGRTSSDPARLTAGPLTLDIERHQVTVGGAPVELTPREFEILRVLMTNPGRLVTKAKLLRAVWGEAYQSEAGYVYVHVSQLRRKLAAADASGRLDHLIVTEPGVGYRVGLPEDDPRGS